MIEKTQTRRVPSCPAVVCRAILSLICLGLIFPAPSAAVVINATTRTDSVADDGRCSLREAVIAANTDSPSGSSLGECPAGDGADTIFLSQAGVYRLSIDGPRENGSRTGDLDIHESLEIHGNTNAGGDPSLYVIDGNGSDRVLEISSSAGAVELVGLTIENGDTVSGELRHVWSPGGGLYSAAAALTLDRVLVRNNRGNTGGGIYLHGGDVVIRRSTIVENTSDADGGGIFHYQGGSLVVQRSVIRENIAYGDNSDGGGLRLRSQYVIWNSTIAGNYTTDDGGGVASDVCCATSSIRRTVIAANSSTRGGGIYLATADLWLRNVTVSSNEVRPSGTSWDGSEIFSWGALTLRNATIRSETPTSGWAIHTPGSISSSNTIVVGRCNTSANTASAGGNVESPSNTCGFTAGSDDTGVSAAQLDLHPLGAYGGPTLTHHPGHSSIAIDGGQASLCQSTDQRNRTRPQDGDGNGSSICDAGAVEVQPCGAPGLITLDHQTETGTKTYEACNEIGGGPSYIVASGADVELRAGEKVVLRNGFRVESGAVLRVEVNPSVGR